MIDAAFWNFSITGAVVLELSAFRKVILIPFPPAIVDNLSARHLGLHPSMIRAGAYPGQKEDILTFSVHEYLVARTDMPTDQAHLLLQVLIDNRHKLSFINSSLRFLSPESVFPEGLPLVPGAARYFREQGVITK